MKDSHRLLVETMFTSMSFKLSEQGFVMPLYIMIMEDDSLVPIILQPKMEITMEQYASIAINAASEMGAVAMFFACEQTMVSKEKNDPELKELLTGAIRASEHPDREDHLTAIYMTKDGECESLISKIHIDPAGTRFTRENLWIDGSVTNLISPWKAGKNNVVNISEYQA